MSIESKEKPKLDYTWLETNSVILFGKRKMFGM